MVSSNSINADVLDSNDENGDVYYFASTNSTIYLHTFKPDYSSMNMTMSVTKYPVPELNGAKQRMATTKDMLVVSCADCRQPGVWTFGKSILTGLLVQANAKYSIKLDALTNGDWYDLEVNDTPDIGYTQIFIASNSTISLLER